MISCQSVPLHAILASSLTLTHMSFSDQINSLSKSCHFHIRDIRRIRHLLPLLQPQHLQIHLSPANLTTAIHFTLASRAQANLNKLQRIQNSLARVITNTSKYQHITPTLKKLHWLPTKQSVMFGRSLISPFHVRPILTLLSLSIVIHPGLYQSGMVWMPCLSVSILSDFRLAPPLFGW